MYASTVSNRGYRVNPYIFSSGHEFGHYMEAIAGFMLLGLGLCVTRHNVGKGYDLTASNIHTGEIWHIEVKAARQGKDGRYKFDLYKKGKNRVKTDHRKSDIVLFLAVNPAGIVTPFIVPTKVISDITQLTIPTNPLTYGGKIASYRNNWSILV